FALRAMDVCEFSGETDLVGRRPNRNGVQQPVGGDVKDVHRVCRPIDRKPKTTVGRNSYGRQSGRGFHSRGSLQARAVDCENSSIALVSDIECLAQGRETQSRGQRSYVNVPDARELSNIYN